MAGRIGSRSSLDAVRVEGSGDRLLGQVLLIAGLVVLLLVVQGRRVRAVTRGAIAALPEGVEHVFVNGVHVVDGGRYDPAARAGRVLRG